MTKRAFGWVIAASAAVGASVIAPGAARAGRSYGTAGVTITEGFDGLPLAPAPGGTSGTTLSNNTIMAGAGAGYTTGWVNDFDYKANDDANDAATQRDIGLPGWHLFHALPAAGTTQAGPSEHARYIQGGGTTSGAGGFWAFNSGTDTTVPAYAEKAMGSVATSVGATAFSNAANPMRIAFEIVNTTGAPLTGFTLTYDGEQYMDGRNVAPEVLAFSYSLNESASSFQSSFGTASYTPVSSLNFTAPSSTGYAGTNGDGTGGNAAVVVDGNLAANRVADITGTVDGIVWEPGASLFLLWTDAFVGSGQNDGLAIDNVRFSAVPEPTGLGVAAAGAATGLLRRQRRRA